MQTLSDTLTALRNRPLTLMELRAKREYQKQDEAKAAAEPECPRCRGAGFLERLESLNPPTFSWPACECRQQGFQAARVRYAGMPRGSYASTFESLDPLPQLDDAIAAGQEMINGAAPWHVLTLAGGVGTGKTHLLHAIGWELLGREQSVKYLYVPDWLDELRATYGNDQGPSFQTVYHTYSSAGTLLIDDLGAERRTDWAVEILTRIVNYRYEQAENLVITTNVLPWDTDAEGRLGARLKDRVFDTNSGRGHVCYTGNESYRTGQ